MYKAVQLAVAGFLTGGVIFTPPVFAQIEVIDAAPETVYRSADGSVRAGSAPAAPQAAASGELFYQLQLLQEEVLQLRGQIEEQRHEIQRLKQQRLDDYINLDRRVSALSGMPTATNAEEQPQAQPQAGTVGATPGVESSDFQAKAYKDAYALVKARKFPEATQAFLDYLAFYPEGEMTPNAYYWLGELYLLDANLEEARNRFSYLLNQYPEHRKAPDSLFKLAQLYFREGNQEKSRELLEQVISKYSNTDSSAPRLAQEFLRQNF
jgi:tol-pal system protein YbgF